MAQSLDRRGGSARSVDKHATVDVQGVAGDVAREVGSAAKSEERVSSTLVDFAQADPTLIGGGDRLFREHTNRVASLQEDDAGGDFDRLTGALQRSAVDASNVLQFWIPRASDSQSFIFVLFSKNARTSAEKVECTSGVTIGPGATAFTRMSFEASWFAQPRVNETMAPLVAAASDKAAASGHVGLPERRRMTYRCSRAGPGVQSAHMSNTVNI